MSMSSVFSIRACHLSHGLHSYGGINSFWGDDVTLKVVKVEVDFDASKPDQYILDEELTDTIGKISKPHLDWVHID